MEEKIKHGEERKRISDELKQKPLTKLEREKKIATVRNGYIICGAQCKNNTRGPCAKVIKTFKMAMARH